MNFKNLPITPILSVEKTKQQEILLEHNKLLRNLLGETILTYGGLPIYT